jgi:hypothetical protein
MIAGFHAAFQMHSTGRTQISSLLVAVDPLAHRLTKEARKNKLSNYLLGRMV